MKTKKSITSVNINAIVAVLVFSGFNTATLALAGFVLIGLCLSFALSLENKNNMKMMSEEAA